MNTNVKQRYEIDDVVQQVYSTFVAFNTCKDPNEMVKLAIILTESRHLLEEQIDYIVNAAILGDIKDCDARELTAEARELSDVIANKLEEILNGNY